MAAIRQAAASRISPLGEMDSSADAPPSLVGEVRGVKLFSDDTVERSSEPMWPSIPADPNFTDGVASKDVVLNRETGLGARIFLPLSVVKASEKESSKKQLPVLVYYHGGGYVAFHPCSSIFHNLCNNIAPKLGLLVISVDYRLAPEHRLPAAFDDSFEALKWIQQQGKMHESGGEEQEDLEPWLKYADVSNCLLMGGSAGGTIAHYMVVRAGQEDLSPLKIKGIIPVVPFYGGVKRSESEIRSLTNRDALVLEDTDTFWLLSLPKGADRNHPFSRCPTAEEVAGVNMPPVLVVVGAKDVLYSRQIEYVEVLRKAGKDVQLLQYNNHGHLLLFPEVEDNMHYSYHEMVHFMDKCFS